MRNYLLDYRTVVEDLLYLKKTWYNTVDEGELRRGTAILRRLLVEGEYGNLWRYLGFVKEPSVVCVDLDSILPYFSPSKIVFAFAGGAKIAGLQSTSLFLHEGDECTAYTDEVAEKSIKSMPVSRYINSTTAYIDGRNISRKEYIQFIANKLGGVHLKKKNEILRDEYHSLKKLEGKVYINFLDAFFHEVQCIGQAIIDSSDCDIIINKFNDAISDRSGFNQGRI